ncbi:ABC transporter ATP-binding protein [Paraconexibacter antarcticus]|uniref:ABC transporter ATP-binding protein n=1 Tax=Paraconexibacter antarcticus TaxID=2949664 RepID=A0ABY5DY18_9ACTN|nr:ABC transporter ATP-binding protein [Paraconexibacter antarcticus]UTI66046.1 ABC transporter ATP-binding protein [Paraconexibacter antarcticus]
MARPRPTGPILEARDLTLRFGEVTAFQDVAFAVMPGELFAVIGPNGAGKTSLFNVLSRVYTPTSGQIALDGRDLTALRPRDLAGAGVARTFQNLGLFGPLSVLDNVLVGRHHLMRAGALRAGFGLRSARAEEREHTAAAMAALERTGMADVAGVAVENLAYGDRKRVEIARALAMHPRLLLLDEPVAGMSADERVEITELVRALHADGDLTILLVEHDMGMVMRVAQRILVLDFGRPIAVGSPAEIQADEAVIRAYLGAAPEAATA